MPKYKSNEHINATYLPEPRIRDKVQVEWGLALIVQDFISAERVQ